MSRLHITTRIIHAATVPLVRNVGPRVADGVKHFMQFLGFGALGVAIILTATIAGANGLPWQLIKTIATTIALTAIGFGVLVVGEQIRLTYTKQDPSVYTAVEPFEQRRPFDG